MNDYGAGCQEDSIAQAFAEPIFLLGFGRSGTTLVQRLLNACSDTVLLGEHSGFLIGLTQTWEKIQITKKWGYFDLEGNWPPNWETWQPWLTPWDETKFREKLTAFIKDLFCHARCWGFKEIRYGSYDDGKVIPFLHELYPEARFLFIIRHPLDTMASVKFRFHEGKFLEGALRNRCLAWIQQYRQFSDCVEALDYQTYFFRYEDLIDRNSLVLDEMLGFLGLPKVDLHEKILATKKGRGSAFKDDRVRERRQFLNPEEKKMVEDLTREIARRWY